MPEIEDVNDLVWELRDEVRELRQALKSLHDDTHASVMRLCDGLLAYAREAESGPFSAREELLRVLGK